MVAAELRRCSAEGAGEDGGVNLKIGLELSVHTTSPSMGEVAAQRPEGVRALTMKETPPEAQSERLRASPPHSALRADSSPIEGERVRFHSSRFFLASAMIARASAITCSCEYVTAVRASISHICASTEARNSSSEIASGG